MPVIMNQFTQKLACRCLYLCRFLKYDSNMALFESIIHTIFIFISLFNIVSLKKENRYVFKIRQKKTQKNSFEWGKASHFTETGILILLPVVKRQVLRTKHMP